MGWQDDPIIEKTPAWEADALVREGAPGKAAKAPKPAIALGAGLVPPRLFTQAEAPNSAGNYPLGRRYSIDDRARYQRSDPMSGVVQREVVFRVTGLDIDNDSVEINSGAQLWDLMGNLVKWNGSRLDVPRQFSPAELYVGKKWIAAFDVAGDEGHTSTFDFRITSRERIRVPAGEFLAFRVEGKGWARYKSGIYFAEDSQEFETLWLLPYLNFPICRQRISLDRRGRYRTITHRDELVALRQVASQMPRAG